MRRIDEKWLLTAGSMKKFSQKITDRDDVFVYIGETDGPALFNIDSREIEISEEIPMGEGQSDFMDPDTRLQYDLATGLLLHESGHVKHSILDPNLFIQEPLALSKYELDIFFLLEESRIEKKIVETWRNHRHYLRRSAIWLLHGDENKEITANEKARILLLGYGRISAGVLNPKDLEIMHPIMREHFGEETINKLRDLWVEFQTQPDEEVFEKKRITKEVAEILLPFEESDSDSEFLEKLKELLSLLELALEFEKNDLFLEKDKKEKELQKAKKENQKQEHRKEFESVFSGTQKESRVNTTRRANADERRSLIHIKKVLERARHRDRIVQKVNTALPPGKLKVGQLMQAKAGADGINPWRKKQRTQTDQPIITMGIMSDISGSMGRTMGPMASINWVMKNAVEKLEGHIEAVYFGNTVYASPDNGLVNIFTAADGSEDFDRAFKVLDGGLNLLYGSGIRILVVCSDGNYRQGQRAATEKWLSECKKYGVHVLWLGLSQGHAVDMTRKTGTTYVPVGENLTQSTELIVDACKKLLRAG